MKVIGKILMIFATFIVMAHAIVPHQHRAQLEVIVHECLFQNDDDTSSNILKKLEDIIQHVNLGEKHLENFRVTNYEYEFSSIPIFEIPEILSLLKFQLTNPEKIQHVYYYNPSYSSTENDLSSGLRAPPSI